MIGMYRRATMRTPTLSSVAFGAIIIGSCILWQLFMMKHVFMETERYRIDTNTGSHNVHIYSTTGTNTRSHASQNIRSERAPESLSRSSSLPQDRMEEDHSLPTTTNQTTTQDPNTLMNLSLIRNSLLREAPWAESHGANHLAYLGAGMLYYSMAYSFRSQTIVVLGSGGGFVPRMLKQAQRDLMASGMRPSKGVYDLFLVDAHLPSAGWGSTFYAANENTTMRTQFYDIRYIFQLTDDAYQDYFRPLWEKGDFSIDYLHVDADHGFEQSWKDFDNYSKLLSDRAVVSFHDTCFDNVTRNCHAEGVPETIEKLRSESKQRGLQVMDLHYLYRGIAFSIKETAPALETPRDRRINFCVNNADLLDRSSDGFSKNGRVGSLGQLGDFMNCTHRYNETELATAKHRMQNLYDETNGIMAVPCPRKGFRRNRVSGMCDKCIPGLVGDNCQRRKYKPSSTKPSVLREKTSGGSSSSDVNHLAEGWLKSLLVSPSVSSRPRAILEVGPNAWTLPTAGKSPLSEDPSSLLFGSLIESSESSTSFGLFDAFSDITVVDPILVTNALWIDPTISKRHRFLPTILKTAIDFDDEEKRKLQVSSSSSPLNLESIDTFVCLMCDDLLSMSTPLEFMKLAKSIFPNLQRLLLGFDYNDRSISWMKDLEWKLERDVTLSLESSSTERKRLALLTLPK